VRENEGERRCREEEKEEEDIIENEKQCVRVRENSEAKFLDLLPFVLRNSAVSQERKSSNEETDKVKSIF